MSRCFPFPPPNYRKERDLNQDLRFTESIKKEQESLSKEKRKDRKRERKEKKDKSKDGSKKLKHGERSDKKQKLNDKDAPSSTMPPDSKSLFKKSLPTELIKNKLQTKDERSGITEEHTLRVLTPEPCESSESTENSSKAGRKIEANNTNQSNSILRFKLPPQKQKDQKPALAADLPCISSKTEPKIIEATQANKEPCFTGQKMTKVGKNPSASEATYFVGRTTSEPKILKASQTLPSKGASSFSAQPAPKPRGASAFPTSEAARYSGRAIPRPKVDVPCFSGRTPPRPIVLKSSPATEAAKLSGRSLPESKALKATTPVPSFSGRVTPKPDVCKAAPASKADMRPEVLKALPASKANCFSEHNLPRPRVVATPADEATCFSGRPAPKVLQASLAKGTPGFSGQTSKTLVATPLNEEAPCSSGHATKTRVIELESSERKSKRSKKHRDDPERSKFKELILNWKPEPLIVHDEEDLGWLFSKPAKQSKVKSDAISESKSCAANEVEKSRHRNPAYAFQPRAHFLHELDLYALPYAVPF